MSVWYFAYGANMSTDVLVGRRGIQPLSSEAARLDGYRLVFDQAAIPLIEPCFASIEPAAADCVHGVLHELSAESADQVDAFEGPTYERITVEVHGEKSGPVTARTYRTRQPIARLLPSRRYLRLLIKGAREHDLPEEYIARLEQQPFFHVPVFSPMVNYVFEHLDRPGPIRSTLRKAAHGAVHLLQVMRRSA